MNGKKRKKSVKHVALFSVEQCRAIRRRLLSWYERHKRDLPWRRREGDGYAQMVAEFMLQQTQVSTVIDYYQRFLKRFPTVRALARANRDEVMALWSGLGYYSRARNLHAAAGRIVDEYRGVVPSEVEELMKLPGIGRYTAGAIASIAYDRPAPVLDGNVVRVFMRLMAIDDDPKSPALHKHLWAVAEALLPVRRCGDFNQGLMELGAMVCMPRSPNCPKCPLRGQCRAYQEDLTGRIPPVAKRTRVLPAAMVIAAVRHGEKLLFVQRPSSGLWASLWELPSEPVTEGEPLQSARQRLRQRLPAGCRLSTKVSFQLSRTLSHRKITFHVYQGRLPGNQTAGQVKGSRSKWINKTNIDHLGISRACEAILKELY